MAELLEPFDFYVVRYTDGSGYLGERGKEYRVTSAKQWIDKRWADKAVEKYPTLSLEVVHYVAIVQQGDKT